MYKQSSSPSRLRDKSSEIAKRMLIHPDLAFMLAAYFPSDHPAACPSHHRPLIFVPDSL